MDDIGFIGFIDLDDTLPVAIQCRNSSGVVSAPSSAPTYTVYPPGFSAYIATGSLDSSEGLEGRVPDGQHRGNVINGV